MTANKNYFQNENILLQKISLVQNTKEVIPLIISIDEVGRGCVAGPVISCASLWIDSAYFEKFSFTTHNWLHLINDSKKLSEKKRTICFNLILEDYNLNINEIPYSNNYLVNPSELITSNFKLHINAEAFTNAKEQSLSHFRNNQFKCISFALGEASSFEVDQFNIWNAVQLAAGRALMQLQKIALTFFPSLENCFTKSIILMDGKHFIKIPNLFKDNLQITVTKADGIFVSVGFSSIIAKVFRDTFMIEQDNNYPNFSFSTHKGYGTEKHLALIKKIGLCSLHRKSFLENYCQPTQL